MRYLLPLLLLACGETSMSQSTKIAGLWTNPNDTRAPEGALADATNVAFYRPGMAGPRRGYTQQNAAALGAVNALAYFSGYLVAHHGASALSRSSDDGATWTAYSGTYSPPDASTKVRFWQAEGSLFVLTSAGVYELDSPTGTWRLTGVPRALDGTATLDRTSSTSGWATPDGQWAYRDVWGYKNGNDRIQFGAVSGRVLVANPANISATPVQISKAAGSSTITVTGPTHGFATGEYVDVSGADGVAFANGVFQMTVTNTTTFTYSDAVNNGGGAPINPAGLGSFSFGFAARNVSRRINIPSGVTTDYFVQVSRSAKSASASSEPSDDLGLVYEAVPTNVDITAGYMTITDETPDSIRGATLYTSTQGMLASRDRPPLARDAATWRGSALYADVKGPQSLLLRFLSVSGLVAGQSTFVFAGPTINDDPVEVLAETAESSPYGEFQIHTTGTVAQNIANTARSFVRMFNAKANFVSAPVRAFYMSGEADAPGQVLIQRTTPGAAAIQVWAYAVPATDFSPTIRNTSMPASVTRVGSTVTATTTVAHGWATGQQVSLSPSTAAFPSGTKTIASTPTGTTFTYTEAGAAVTEPLKYFEDLLGDRLTSSADDFANGLMWSPPDEPWAVPTANIAFVGDSGTTIERIVPTRDKLLIFTDRGLWHLWGDYPNFFISELDSTVNLAARETAVANGGKVLAFTNQGLVEVLESARILSVPMEDTLRSLLANHSSNVALRAFALSSESDHAYLLWLPDDSSDAYASQAFPLWMGSGEAFSGPWNINATCGLVHPTQDRIYLGTSTGYVWKERKAYAAADHADPSGAFSVTIEPVQQMPAGPGASALVDLAALDFKEANFSTASLYFATDLSPTLSDAISIGPPQGATTGATELVCPVPQAQQRGTRWRMKLVWSVNGVRFALQGWTLRARLTSKRPGR